MALFCRNNMTPVQRRTYRWMSVTLLLTVIANVLTVGVPDAVTKVLPFLSILEISPGHAPLWKMVVAGVLSLFPVLLAVLIAARYLGEEPDEFIRAMLMQALLWGIACTMAADAIAGVMMLASGQVIAIALLNADVLFVSTMVSFRLAARRFSR